MKNRSRITYSLSSHYINNEVDVQLVAVPHRTAPQSRMKDTHPAKGFTVSSNAIPYILFHNFISSSMSVFIISHS
jgi:hypothetical protein